MSKQKLPVKVCLCGKEFEPKRKWQTFCSPACRKAHWEETHPRIFQPAQKP
jgi:hypothetical protein